MGAVALLGGNDMMGVEETRAQLAELAALVKARSRVLSPEEQARAQALLLGLGAEVLGALFSIATSLEALAACVQHPNPARDGVAYFAASDVFRG
jgi:hypothetical protein